MTFEVIRGILIPFAGTVLGAACVFFMRSAAINKRVEKALTGFAGGVMTAASVWSLLIPAMSFSDKLGKLAFIPAATGFITGILFLLILDKLILYMQRKYEKAEVHNNKIKKTSMLVLAVVLHNFPEGMAVGVVFAGRLTGNTAFSAAAALALAVGIGIQNFPEGAIISMPLAAKGIKKGKAFLYGAMSGIVEPLGAILTIAAAGIVVPVLPYLLGFAAGAMIYVVVEELIPEMAEEGPSDTGTIMFSVGFLIMMIMDVALG